LLKLSAQVGGLHSATIEPVTIRAIPLKSAANRKSDSNGFAYFGLKDPHTRATMDATIPGSHAARKSVNLISGGT
jgi:hypothetical protein